ncbi:MAG: hypothetical protein AAF702_48050 [Chloroflexota bacterium]
MKVNQPISNRHYQKTMKSVKHIIGINILLLICLIGSTLPAAAAHVPALLGQDFQTTITVNTTSDPDATTASRSCTLNGNGVRPAEDGLCSLRRAIIEASKRNLADRPILIAFDLPADEENSVAGTWTINIEAGLPGIETLSSVVEPESMVTIDGATQPGGRTDGPAVFINTSGPLSLNRNGNTIRNLGFYGGGTIQLSRASSRDRQGNQLVENVWMGLSEDGQSMVLEDEDNPNGLAGGGITINQSDGNIVRNNVVVGATGRAINILTGDDNEVTGNLIGTRADGTVPIVPAANQCIRSLLYDPNNWYGGWGIQVSGADNMITNNRIAGLHQVQTANETSPMAIDVSNAENALIQNNIIGIDSAGNEVGVCGIGINAIGKSITSSGDSIKLIENTIVRSRKGFEEPESDTAIYLGGTSGITVQGNIIRDATEKVIGFSSQVPTFWRNFEPAKITDIEGTSVSGKSGADSPCPNCVIELFLDDLDNQQEALEMVGTATADANGMWSTTLTKAVPDGMALRTTSTTQDVNIIGTLDRGTSTKMSGLQVPPTNIEIEGPTEGFTGIDYTFDYQVLIEQVMTPLTMTVSATDQETFVTTINKTNEDFVGRWASPGTKTITIRAENCLGAVTRTHQIEIAGLRADLIEVTGPTTGDTGQSYLFNVVINQPNVALPILVRTEITDDTTKDYVFNSTEFSIAAMWTTTGTKTIKLIISNGGDPVEQTYTITIDDIPGGSDDDDQGGSDDEYIIFLPNI